MITSRVSPGGRLPRILATLILLLVIFSSLLAQTVPCPAASIPVGVRDTNGTFVSDVPASAYRATVHGKKVDVRSAALPTSGPRVVLILDVSGSMSAKPSTWQHAMEAALDVAGSTTNTHVALVLFASQVLDVLDFTHSRQEILDRLQTIARRDKPNGSEGKGQTALWDAILQSSAMLQSPETGDAIFAITDGGDNHSERNWGNAKRQLLQQGIRFFAFLPFERYFPTEEEKLGIENAESLAEQTGGDWTIIDGDVQPAAFRQHLALLYDALIHYYVLNLDLPAFEGKKSLKIEIVDPQRDKKKQRSAKYPREIYGCPSRSSQK